MPILYWEKQVAGLCGVHCINTLLQGSYVSAVDLMEVAREFDERERRVMMEMGYETTDFIKFAAEDSGNVADDGNYSVQVLAKVLSSWNVELIPLTSPDLIESKKDPTIEGAFICNLRAHWFTIRKIDDEFYNLNSLSRSGPKHISKFYLSLLLDTLTSRGFTIFAVRGNLPDANLELGSEGKWIWVDPPSHLQQQKQQQQQQMIEPGQDKDFEKAIELSKQTAAQEENDFGDEELERALKISMELSR